MGISSLNLLLESVIWVMVGLEAIVPINSVVPISKAITAVLYAKCQCLQASFTKGYNYASAVPNLCT